MVKTENAIIQGLIHDHDYMCKVLPYLKKEYFSTNSYKKLFKLIYVYINKYNKAPTIDAIEIVLEKVKLDENTHSECIEILGAITERPNCDMEWLINETETFCRDKAIYNAIMDSISIIDGEDKIHTKDAIPSLLQDAISISFDPSVGHDYFEKTEYRHEYYNRVEEKIPFDLSIMNKVTKGGLSKKTLTIFLAQTGVGKSMVMCHLASSMVARGKNVLYITLEMSEEKIAERIDANLLNTNIDDIKNIELSKFTSTIDSIHKKSSGQLIIKEYPTSSAHSGHFKTLLNDLKTKREFVPDVIFIDYINICTSSRYAAGMVNSYTNIKSIAEEFRGLAVEFNVPVISATQITRSGFNKSDINLEDTSESIALPSTCDYMFGLISSDDLKKMKQILIKRLKDRYGDTTYYNTFMVGVDHAKMKLYDIECSSDDVYEADSINNTKDELNYITSGLSKPPDFTSLKF